MKKSMKLQHMNKQNQGMRNFRALLVWLVCCLLISQGILHTIHRKQALNHQEAENSRQSEVQLQESSTNTIELDYDKERIDEKEIYGVYYSTTKVNSQDKVKKIIDELKGTGVNAVVLDVKDDSGRIMFDMDQPLAKNIGAINPKINNVEEMLRLFHENGIYVIGRVVAFKDPILAQKRPDYAIKRKDGTVFYDQADAAWLNPYNENCWWYLLDIAQQAAQIGFDEIQFDYVRFSTEVNQKSASVGVDMAQYTKTQVITDFMKYAVNVLHKYDVAVSADVFGTIISSSLDASIVGQDYVELARYLDYICPMIYPSHYADGCYGIEVPDLEPYELIFNVLQESNKELSVIGAKSHCAKVRPWLQDFTARWKKQYQSYGTKEVGEQIQGVYDSGYTQWLLWNSSGNYSFVQK